MYAPLANAGVRSPPLRLRALSVAGTSFVAGGVPGACRARTGAHGRRRGLGLDLAAQMGDVGALAAAVARGDAHEQQRVTPAGEPHLMAGRARVVVGVVDHEFVAAHGEDVDLGLRLGAADDHRGLFQSLRRVQFVARFLLAELQRRQSAEAQCVESGGGRFRRCGAAAEDHPVDARRFARERLQLEFNRGLAPRPPARPDGRPVAGRRRAG